MTNEYYSPKHFGSTGDQEFFLQLSWMVLHLLSQPALGHLLLFALGKSLLIDPIVGLLGQDRSGMGSMILHPKLTSPGYFNVITTVSSSNQTISRN
jgi:hypothetical protein